MSSPTSSQRGTDTGRDNRAIAAVVLGVLAIVSIFALPGLGVFVAIVLGIVAIVLGVKARRSAAGGTGAATTGVVLGAIGAGLALLFLVLGAIGIAILSGTEEGQQLLDEAEQQSAPAVAATV